MKEITKKILESGIIDKNIALLFEKWGSLDPGASDLVSNKMFHSDVRETLLQLAEQIEDLIDQDVETIKETRFNIEAESIGEYVLEIDDTGIVTSGVLTKFNHLLIPPLYGQFVFRGVIVFSCNTKKKYKVLDIDKIYNDENIVAYQLTLEELDAEVSKRELPKDRSEP